MRIAKLAAAAAVGLVFAGCSVLPGSDSPDPGPSSTAGASGARELAAEGAQGGCQIMFDQETANVSTLVDQVKELDVASPAEAWEAVDGFATQISADLAVASEQFPSDIQPYVHTLQALFDFEHQTLATILPWLGKVISGGANGAISAISDYCSDQGYDSLP